MPTRRNDNKGQQNRTQRSNYTRRAQNQRQAVNKKSLSKKSVSENSGTGAVFTSVSFILILACLAFGISVFFRVSHIEVKGNKTYSPNKIIEASGIENGDNLMFMNTSTVEAKIYENLVHIGKVSVERKLPNKINITICESGTAGVVETEGGLWLIDENCRLLDKCNVIESESYIKVIGISAVKPQKGSLIKVSDEGKPRLEYLKDVLITLSKKDMLKDVSTVNVSNPIDAEFKYMTKFKVKLGPMENTEYKVELLKESVKRLEANEMGTFDLSKDREAHFNPTT